MNSLASSRRRMPARAPLPDGLQCSECGYIPSARREATLEWATQYRKDLVTYLGGRSGCSCEQGAQEAERRRRRHIDEANLPDRNDSIGPRTFENFGQSRNTALMYQAADEFACGQGAPVLVLVGLTGCGKTHLLEAVCRRSLGEGIAARYERAMAFLDRLRHTHESDEEGMFSVLEWYQSLDVLGLDDVGLGKPTEFAVGHLTGIVDQRIMDGRRLLVATNLKDREEMRDAGWGDRLASRLYDQQTGAVRVVWSEAGDYRAREDRPKP